MKPSEIIRNRAEEAAAKGESFDYALYYYMIEAILEYLDKREEDMARVWAVTEAMLTRSRID